MAQRLCADAVENKVAGDWGGDGETWKEVQQFHNKVLGCLSCAEASAWKSSVKATATVMKENRLTRVVPKVRTCSREKTGCTIGGIESILGTGVFESSGN
mmetsp:Transcript_25057/g.69126  ORF Transcript_25057/g.69126 Transcript_25057/m.69126 type:complete len:100 (+) Transcript_25057:317-616(+)